MFFVVGPSHTVFPSIDSFSARVRVHCGLELQRSKTKVLTNGESPPEMSPDMQLAGDLIDGVFYPGLDVYGCPVGSIEWVNWWLLNKVQKLRSTKEKTCSLLQDDKQALHNLLSLSFSKKMDYLAATLLTSGLLAPSLMS